MEVAATLADLRTARRGLAGSVGLVPTMGALHAGHLSLIDHARRQNDHVVVSIFVNPTQFGPNEDFASYPRDPERDLVLLNTADVTLVFTPTVDVMYPANFQTAIEVADVSQGLEGARRPGHFRGVATVVGKLFNMVQPDRAYFGQKDAQQVAVIRRMVADLNYPLNVVVIPILRADDGLALSSRNVRLSPPERAAAPVIYRALSVARAQFADQANQPIRDAETLRRIVRETLSAEPLVKIEYVSLSDAETLHEIDGAIQHSALLSLAVRIGQTRLIDNVLLEIA